MSRMSALQLLFCYIPGARLGHICNCFRSGQLWGMGEVGADFMATTKRETCAPLRQNPPQALMSPSTTTPVVCSHPVLSHFKRGPGAFCLSASSATQMMHLNLDPELRPGREKSPLGTTPCKTRCCQTLLGREEQRVFGTAGKRL